ncbi:MAG: spore coat protein CotJB [Clostridia bacterium]|nr:spore coat protein CotJB [Clostridia bacterium]
MSQGAMFETIRAYSFVMDDLRLYLDTHPRNKQALNMFLDTMKKRNELLVEYTNIYGPIDSYYINSDGTWSWINEPMPWQTEAN